MPKGKKGFQKGNKLSLGNKYRLGKTHTKKTKEKMKIVKLGNKNPNWKGNSVTYGALHDWIKSKLKKPKKCNLCGKKTDFLDLANISQKYKRDLSDWEYICRKCHMIKDGRINNLKQYK